MKLEQKTENLQRNMVFDFTSEEISELDSMIRNRKFPVKNQIEVVYPENSLQKLKYFINSLRLFEHLRYYFSNVKEETKKSLYLNLYKKIDKVLLDYNLLYIDAEILHGKLSREGNFAKHRIKRKIDDFLTDIDNSPKINKMMDLVHQLGQHTIMVNPSDIMGHS